jgi:mono/diheme cytochrome c family protein
MKIKITGSIGVGICVALSLFCFLLSCGDRDKATADRTDPKFQQYYNQGELLYQKNCANCHQKNGRGLGRLYPPLDSSDYMSKNFEDVICLMRYGKKGELTVNGVSFNQPMPGIPTLTDLEIAEIATYIYNSWSHERGLIDVNRITDLMKKCDSEYTGSRN